MSILVLAYMGTGKDVAVDSVVGRDKSLFQLPIDNYMDTNDYPSNLIEDISKERKSRKHLAVLTGACPKLMDSLVEENVAFVLVYPGRKLRDVYVDRLTNKGVDPIVVGNIKDGWDDMVDEFNTFSRRNSSLVSSVRLSRDTEDVLEVLQELQVV